MKKLSFVAAIIVLSATSAFAATKTYQVTGPVLALTDSSITVQKGTEKWEIARDSSTTLPATVKAGSKVTVYYSMTASKVDDKGAAAPAAATTTKPNATTDKKAK